jgi:hypothetical protein
MGAIQIQPVMSVRLEELRRRVESLPTELAAWRDRTKAGLDLEVHSSQLDAISVLMDAFSQQQTGILRLLDPAGQSGVFQTHAVSLVTSIIASQRVWNFFRSKLELRFSPDFKDVLWVADTIAWDCYRPVLEDAADAGILPTDHLREPPLTYLTAEFSPATWQRGSRPNDGRNYNLGSASLPIPVIEVPWDHVTNLWELLSMHHEVGHDLEADLRLRDRLKTAIGVAVPAERRDRWLAWQAEVIADLVGLQLAGPAYAEMLMNLLLLPIVEVTNDNAADPHPTHYLRLLMNAAYIRTLAGGYPGVMVHAQRLEDTWLSFYGDQPKFKGYVSDFPAVFKALMDQPFDELKTRTLRECISYSQADDLRIRNTVGYILNGEDKPAGLRPRHCVSAARLAVSQAAQQGLLSEKILDDINLRTARLVHDNAPRGVRADNSSNAHREFIAGYVTNDKIRSQGQ